MQHRKLNSLLAVGAIAGYLGFASSAEALIVLGFEQDAFGNDLAHGDIISDNSGLIFPGLNITVSGSNSGNALIFDTSLSNTADPDLEAPFDDPNTAILEMFEPGNVVIIGNDNGDVDDDPDGGVITFDFQIPVAFVSFDYFDTDDGGTTLIVEIEDTLGNIISTGVISGGEVVGDNEFSTFNFAANSGQEIARFALTGSGAIDNVAFAVPEPTTLGLLGAGLVVSGLALRRRRAGD